MEWLAFTLGAISILGLLWNLSQIGSLIEGLATAEMKIDALEGERDRQRKDIDSLSGLLRAQTGIIHERR